METPLLYMPLLHENISLFQKKPLAYAHSLGVGLKEQNPNTWVPSNYAFTTQEVAACLMDMKAMGEAALSGVPLQALAAMQSPYSQLQVVEEQEALDAFVHSEQDKNPSSQNIQAAPPKASVHVLRAAQKFLLWAWLMEEHVFEIQSLSQNYSESIQTLVQALGVEQDEALGSLENIQNTLGNMSFPLPPWELVLENAAHFLPEACHIVINSEDMGAALQDVAPWLPLSDASLQMLGVENAMGKECTLSIGQALQKSEKQLQAAPWLEKKLHCIILESWQ